MIQVLKMEDTAGAADPEPLSEYTGGSLTGMPSYRPQFCKLDRENRALGLYALEDSRWRS